MTEIKKIGSVAIAALTAMASKSYTYTVAASKLAIGSHIFKIVADATSIVKETSEKNNYRRRTVTVKAPDLKIMALLTETPTVSLNGNVQLSFYVYNGGNYTAKASTAYIYDGSKKIGSVAIAALATGKSKKYTYTIAAGKLALGAHTIKVVADGNLAIKESNESNNAQSCNVTVKAPDLTISSLAASASTVTRGSNVVLKITVKNQGNYAATSPKIDIYDGSKKIGTVKASTLASGKSATCNYTVAAEYLTKGTHNFKAVVDGDRAIRESNESNNVSKTCTVTVKMADLTVAIASNPTVGTGNSVKLNFTVKNQGEGVAAASTASIYSDGNKIGTVAIAALNGGKSANYSYTIGEGVLSKGIHTLKIAADTGFAVEESNESNNTADCNVVCTEPILAGTSGNDVLASGIGDDALYGNGGYDIFCFGENWGKDSVHQLDSGHITLWFKSGSQENWDNERQVYTDGENSVSVIGDAPVTLRFGDAIASVLYTRLNMAGAFDSTDAQILDDNKYLASL